MKWMTPIFVSLLIIDLATLRLAAQRVDGKPASAPLHIVVIAGEDAVNVVQQRTSVAPIVEVRDRNNQPVAGAIVKFTIQGGKANFGAGANAISVTTNATGQAAVTGFTPTGTGAVHINVAAAFQGQTATATITQTNVATAAQVASASTANGTSGAAGGGGIGPGTITAITAAGVGSAGAYYGYKKYQEGEPPVMESVTAFPGTGFQGATSIQAAAGVSWHSSDSKPATLKIEWGDGSVSNVSIGADGGGVLESMQQRHVYQTAGLFTIRSTFEDAWHRTASGETTVTIKSFTGRWSVGSTGNVFVLTQSGAALTGTYTVVAGAQGAGSVTGTVTPPSGISIGGAVTLTVTPTGGGVPTTFSGVTSNINGDQILGTLTAGTSSSSLQLIRQ